MVYTLLFFFFQNAVCFIILTYLVPVLFTFYIQGVLKLKKNNSGAKRLIHNCNESCYLCIFRKHVEKIQVSSTYDENIVYFTCRHMYNYDNISLNSSYNVKCLRPKLYGKSKHTFCVRPLYSDNRAVYEICGKILCRAGQATDDDIIRRMRFAGWITKDKHTQTHTQNT